jgi:hypothetical protein
VQEKANIDSRTARFDLERRVAILETMLHGHTLPTFTAPTLIRLYMDAHRPPAADLYAARAQVRQLYLLDARLLMILGRLVKDPFPFRPFLLLADRCVARGLESAMSARQHVLAVAQGLLNAMDLDLLEPRDVMGDLRVNEALQLLKL